MTDSSIKLFRLVANEFHSGISSSFIIRRSPGTLLMPDSGEKRVIEIGTKDRHVNGGESENEPAPSSSSSSMNGPNSIHEYQLIQSRRQPIQFAVLQHQKSSGKLDSIFKVSILRSQLTPRQQNVVDGDNPISFKFHPRSTRRSRRLKFKFAQKLCRCCLGDDVVPAPSFVT